MKIVGTKIVNGRIANVWEYTEEDKAAIKAKAEEAKKAMHNSN